MSLFGIESYSYNSSIRRYTVLFGTLFSNMVLKRGDKWIKVPLRYGKGNMYEKVAQSVAEREETRMREIVPAMSFYLSDIQRDGVRQTGPQNNVTVAEGYIAKSRVPYILTFNLDTRNKNTEDHLQILEQIATTFDPSVTVKFEPIEKASPSDLVENVVINLESFEYSDDEENEEARIIDGSYIFTVRGYLYKRISKVDVVKEVVIGSGTSEEDIAKTLFVFDNEGTKTFNDLESLQSLIEQGLVETVMTNPTNVEATKPKTVRARRKKTT